MHALAKRIHNITPRNVQVTFEDDSIVVLEMRSAEFFQESFQAEGTAPDGTTYRLVTEDEDDSLIAGRETDGGWATAGTVVAVEPAE